MVASEGRALDSMRIKVLESEKDKNEDLLEEAVCWPIKSFVETKRVHVLNTRLRQSCEPYTFTPVLTNPSRILYYFYNSFRSTRISRPQNHLPQINIHPRILCSSFRLLPLHHNTIKLQKLKCIRILIGFPNRS
jgi:hypothetical protein